MGNLGYDLSGIGEDKLQTGGNGGWKVKPDGWYRVMATEAPVKPNKAQTGQVVHLKMTHIDAKYPNSFDMTYLNVQHPKQKVQEIGQAQLKSWAIATGHESPNHVADTSELLNKPFMVRLYSVEEGGQHSDANGYVQKVGGYMSMSAYEEIDKEEHSSSPPAGPDVGDGPLNDIPF